MTTTPRHLIPTLGGELLPQPCPICEEVHTPTPYRYVDEGTQLSVCSACTYCGSVAWEASEYEDRVFYYPPEYTPWDRG
jgi:hypothetical protein